MITDWLTSFFEMFNFEQNPKALFPLQTKIVQIDNSTYKPMFLAEDNLYHPFKLEEFDNGTLFTSYKEREDVFFNNHKDASKFIELNFKNIKKEYLQSNIEYGYFPELYIK